MKEGTKKVSKEKALKAMENIFQAFKKAFGEKAARKIMKLKPINKPKKDD
jgi:hypothetical protein